MRIAISIQFTGHTTAMKVGICSYNQEVFTFIVARLSKFYHIKCIRTRFTKQIHMSTHYRLKSMLPLSKSSVSNMTTSSRQNLRSRNPAWRTLSFCRRATTARSKQWTKKLSFYVKKMKSVLAQALTLGGSASWPKNMSRIRTLWIVISIYGLRALSPKTNDLVRPSTAG